jgi:hypothetical protein
VHALETIHGALRPQGLLLDVRPALQHPWVVIQRGAAANRSVRIGEVARLGQMDDSYRIGTLASADASLQTLIDAGRFVQERAETFPFVYHFDSVETWLAYMAQHWSSALISGEVIDQAREELAREHRETGVTGETGEVLVLRAIRAVRLRRV